MKKLFFILFLGLLVNSCSDPNQMTDLTFVITGTSWKLSSCFNISTGASVVVSGIVYHFDVNGSFESGTDGVTEGQGKWMFLDNGKYIMIASDVYRVISLDESLFQTRYGDIEFTFLPAS